MKQIINNFCTGLMNEENIWVSNDMEISQVIMRYYATLFSSSGTSVEKMEEIFSSIQPLVSEDINMTLESPFSVKEVKMAVFAISADKSPGPDGMNAMFYQKHWDTVGPLVTKTVIDCLDGAEDISQINSTLVTLIPKVKEPKSVSDFRPISLCNVLYKILSKALINRIKPILPVIIHGTQSAFVQGRFITDNALLAYECLHSLRVKKTGRKYYAAMKLDMSKAYVG